MREIIFDTETTGFYPATGDRLVEIGCVELINHIPSGRHYHVYINPQRSMPEEAFRVHGLSEDFLAVEISQSLQQVSRLLTSRAMHGHLEI